MKISISRGKIILIPERDIERSFISDTMHLLRTGDTCQLMLSNAGEVDEIDDFGRRKVILETVNYPPLKP